MASITLLGNAVEEITIGDAFVDAGFTAVDDIAGDVTGEVVTTGTVRKRVGSYTITYTLPDTVANVATTVVETRTVNVVAESKNVDTAFDIGDETRLGVDITGSAFDGIADSARTGVVKPQASALFSETALDPYEVANSK